MQTLFTVLKRDLPRVKIALSRLTAVGRESHDTSGRIRYSEIRRKGERDLNWITGIQRAIDYMEHNLTGELDYEEIAKRACSSSFYFQRVFSILCGVTLGEYIRARRLTQAGTELTAGEARVVDTALKYGYDSPESFARAFTRFHGLTPSQAKLPGVKLKSFSRLHVKLILEGGHTMDYKIVKKEAFRVLEKVKWFPEDEELRQAEIPAFWNQARKEGVIPTLCRAASAEPAKKILGICYGNSRGEGEPRQFPYSIAVGYSGREPAPEGFRVNTIPAATWAVFPCRGAMPQAIQETWRRIYAEFFPTADYAPTGGIDIEAYSDGDMAAPDYECEIWVAVERK